MKRTQHIIFRVAPIAIDAGPAAAVGGRRRLFRSSRPAGGNLEAQASKLKTRTKSILDKLIGALAEVPPQLLQSLHHMCHSRVLWPEGVLYPSEIGVLNLHNDGAYAPKGGRASTRAA